MHRLFVAVRPPAPVRARLTAAMGGISGARWQSDDQIHLTLRFIGEADRHLARDIDAALGAVHHPRFEIAVNGLGIFDRRGRAGVVWAGVSPPEPLRTLHNKVDQALARVGVAPEQRAYTPHITLARLNRSAGPIRDLIEEAGGFRTEPFPIEAFILYESRLTPEGALYTPLERYLLA